MRLEFQLSLSGHVPNLLTKLQPICHEILEVLDVTEEMLKLRKEDENNRHQETFYLPLCYNHCQRNSASPCNSPILTPPLEM